MRRALLFSALLVIGTAAAALAADVPIDHLSLPLPRGGQVHLNFPVGELLGKRGTAGEG